MPISEVDLIINCGKFAFNRSIKKVLYAPPPQSHIILAVETRFIASLMVLAVNSVKVFCISAKEIPPVLLAQYRPPFSKGVIFRCSQSKLKYSRPVLFG